MPLEKGASVAAEDLGKCPFCGSGDIAVCWEPFCVLHSTPMCERFNREEPDVFLRSVIAARKVS